MLMVFPNNIESSQFKNLLVGINFKICYPILGLILITSKLTNAGSKNFRASSSKMYHTRSPAVPALNTSSPSPRSFIRVYSHS